MSTFNTHAETVQQKQFLTPKLQLSDLLWIQGKSDDDDGLGLTLTMQESHDTDANEDA